MSQSVSVVIPVFNSEKTAVSEVENIVTLLSAKHIDYEIIIADDKSSDETYSLLKRRFAKNIHVTVSQNKINKGIAQNIKSLYKAAEKQFVILYSIDGDWNVRDIIKLIKAQRQHNADIVIGKRTKKKGYTLDRKLVTLFHNTLPILLFGVNTIDAGSIKLFRRSLFNQTTIMSDSVFFEAEFIIKAAKRKKKIVSTSVTYSRKATRKRHFIHGSLILQSLKDILQLRLSFFG